ncbi:hypothetical protein C1I98_34495 [Spongiactinospora gelatinilytica]|uniref:HTH tetR-type domain-containing protein n=1 Tax=Spongiactinospora gelatinilytica TaxID=2666298 RepID=A0A2W2ERY4_9ACTN|nr:hypothetical protein C1I98_34495 [Spongiactinospora gelatinilytica]
MTAKRRPRVGARQRREEVIEAALVEFSRKGLRGGSTIAIARRAGLSHANLFRLFPTKKKLFLAVLTRGVREDRAGDAGRGGHLGGADRAARAAAHAPPPGPCTSWPRRWSRRVRTGLLIFFSLMIVITH